MRVVTTVSGIVISLFWFCAPAQAHGVHVFGYLEAGQIKGEGYFSRGVKAKSAVVELFDAAGKLVGSTKTDAQGRFALKLPPGVVAPLKLVLKAGPGHQGEYKLSAQDLGQAPATAAAPAAPGASPAAGTAAMDPRRLEQVVSRVLDRKLAPINRRLVELGLKQGVSLQDVMAGLGYILGLFGIAAWVASRRQRS